MYARSFHQGQWEHELFPAPGKVPEVSDLLLSGSSFSGFMQFSLKHGKIGIQSKAGGTRCWSLELSFLAVHASSVFSPQF